MKKDTSLTIENYDNLRKIVSNYPPFSDKDNIKLFKEYEKTKNKSIKEKLVLHNMGLVIKRVQIYNNGTVDLADLCMYGVEGLITAINRFDLSKNASFSTYAYIWIDSVIKQNTRINEKNIKFELRLNAIINKINKLKNEYYKENGTTPSIEEMANDLQIDIEKIKKAVNNNYSYVSLQEKINVDEYGSTELKDFIEDENTNVEEETIKNCFHDELINFLKYSLTEKQFDYIISYFGLNGQKPKKYTEIAKEKNVSAQCVQEKVKNSITRLQKNPYIRKKLLEYYYD